MDNGPKSQHYNVLKSKNLFQNVPKCTTMYQYVLKCTNTYQIIPRWIKVGQGGYESPNWTMYSENKNFGYFFCLDFGLSPWAQILHFSIICYRVCQFVGFSNVSLIARGIKSKELQYLTYLHLVAENLGRKINEQFDPSNDYYTFLFRGPNQAYCLVYNKLLFKNLDYIGPLISFWSFLIHFGPIWSLIA